MKYAINNLIKDLNVNYIGWVDFGSMRELRYLPPDREFMYNVLRNGKYHLRTFKLPTLLECDYLYNIMWYDFKFMGGFQFGDIDAFYKYYSLFHY